MLLLITGGTISISTAQAKFKVGNNPFTIEKSAVLEVESKDGGFLPPRMLKIERDSIHSPVAGLIVWCTDCNHSVNLPNGELCIYQGNIWVSLPFAIGSTSSLSTGRMSDANRAVSSSPTSAIISGTLKEVFGPLPTETGIVYREITGNDFAVLPVLDAAGNAVAPTGKQLTDKVVTTAGGIISATVTTDRLAYSPYYFRTYAKSDLGISYGNPVIFNTGAPQPSMAVIINTVPLAPIFTGTLTVNAGTPINKVTEYGYWSSTSNSPDNMIPLSTPEAIAALNEQLNNETLKTNINTPLTVTNYEVKAIALTYFGYYVIADGISFSPGTTSFTPLPNPVTGGTAIAEVTAIDNISKPVMAGEVSNSSITVHFNVTKAGSYDFKPVLQTGATTGLTMSAVNGNFFIGNQAVTFQIVGLPKKSLEGNIFAISTGIGGLSTGAIQLDKTRLGNINDSNAYCDNSHTTAVVSVFSPKTGRVWMDRNLGASQQAVSVTDYLAYGCLYQWGRGNDGHASITWTNAATGTPVNGVTNTLATTDTPADASFIISIATPFDWRSPQNNNLWQGVNGINNPCPAGYRIPDITELMAEGEAYSIINNQKAFESDLKFVPVPWRRTLSGSLEHVSNEDGNYWSSSVSGVLSSTLVCFDGIPVGHYHGFGYSVRCIKN